MSVRRRKAGAAADGEVIAFTYARVSSDDQEKDGMSLPVQDQETLSYIAGRSRMTFGGAFVDVQTGTVATRVEYQRMLAAARARTAEGHRVAIVTVKQTRFGRDVEESARAWKELLALGAELHATRDGGQLNDELMFMFRAVLAQNDVRIISEGVSATFAKIRRNGWLKPGRPRWGYRWVAATAEQRASGAPMVVPVPHEDEADYVRELFRRRASGESCRKLAIWTTTLPAAARGGRELGASGLREILASTVYVARNPTADGSDPLDGEPGKWEPLCDDATWRAVHPRAGERENAVAVPRRSDWLLTSYLFCEACGSRMCGSVRRSGVRLRPGRLPYVSSPRRIYQCTSRMRGASFRGPICNRTIDADTIEREVLRTFGPLLAVLAQPGVADVARRAARELEQRASATGDARRLINYEQDRAAIVEQRDALTIAVALGQIPQDAYLSAMESIRAKLAPIAAEIERLRARQATERRSAERRPMVDVLLDQASFWHSAVETGTIDERRAFLQHVLDRATPRRIKIGEYRAGIELTALGRSLLEVGAATRPPGAGRVESEQLAWANCIISPRPDAVA